MRPQQHTSSHELSCTLMEEELKVRRQLVRKTLKPYIRSVETTYLGLTITFLQGLRRTQIEEFVALERQCCAFLTFDIVENEVRGAPRNLRSRRLGSSASNVRGWGALVSTKA